MIGVLAVDLGDGYWQATVRDQTLRVYLHTLMYQSPWWVPVAGDRVLMAPSTTGWTGIGLMGKGVPSAS